MAQSCPTLCSLVDYIVHGILQARILVWVAFPFSRGSSQPRDGTQVSCIAGRFFTSWATREAQEYWSLSLLQRIFLTQESNQGLLHCKQILYQLSYQGSPLRNRAGVKLSLPFNILGHLQNIQLMMKEGNAVPFVCMWEELLPALSGSET